MLIIKARRSGHAQQSEPNIYERESHHPQNREKERAIVVVDQLYMYLTV